MIGCLQQLGRRPEERLGKEPPVVSLGKGDCNSRVVPLGKKDEKYCEICLGCGVRSNCATRPKTGGTYTRLECKDKLLFRDRTC